MLWGADRLFARLFAAALGALLALTLSHAPAQAQTENREGRFYGPSDTPCHTVTTAQEAIAELAYDTARWSCEDASGIPPDAKQIAIRFDLRGRDLERPGLLINAHTYREFDRFKRFQVFTVGTEDIVGSGWLSMDELPPTSPVWKSRVEAPPSAGMAEAIIVRIDAPENARTIARFELEDIAPQHLLANGEQMLAAVLCGLLLAPALIGVSNFRALRSRFAIYHVIYCLLAVVQIAAIGGLLPLVIDLPRKVQFVILHVSFDLIAAVSALFAAHVIEREKLSQLSRRVLYGIAILAVALGVMRVSLGMTIGAEGVGTVYYAGYVVFLAGLAFALTDPLRKGSRAVLFLLAGYMPLVAIGVIRIAVALLTDFEIRFHAVMMQHFALSWQVLVCALAVADRFLVIRRERDRARTTAQLLAHVSERDSLTGLYNRRIIAERYDRLRAEGFHSMALIDLDHFKDINDTLGHTAGDRVLCAVAKALDADPNTIVVRMGGEEFALLMRGSEIFERAERRRMALAEAASAALGDSRKVTASMGLIELDAASSQGMDFDTLYDRADRLLYEAKNTGRNRAISEKLKVFQPRRRNRRSAHNRAAA